MRPDTRAEIATPSPWRAGSVVFSARTRAGTEAVLWLVPRFDPLDESTPEPPRVRFATRSTEPDMVAERAHVTRLQATWWLFDPSCTSRACTGAHCVCGEVALADVVGLLDPSCAAAARAAHADLLDAVLTRLEAACSACGQGSSDDDSSSWVVAHVGELASVARDLVAGLFVADMYPSLFVTPGDERQR